MRGLLKGVVSCHSSKGSKPIIRHALRPAIRLSLESCLGIFFFLLKEFSQASEVREQTSFGIKIYRTLDRLEFLVDQSIDWLAEKKRFQITKLID